MITKKIDKNLIDDLRLSFITKNWIFDEAEKNEIVHKELTHDYLLKNFNVDKSIYKYYHLPTSKLLSDSEFQEMKDNGFIDTLRPYSNIIYGAYYSRSDLNMKLAELVYSKIDYTIEGKKIKYFTDLIPYFKEYAKGFENGFYEFDNSQIKPFLTMLADKQDYVNKVFEFVTKQIFASHSYATLETGFTANQNNEIINAFDNGQKQGYFYRAWSVIFSNHQLFTHLFQYHLKTLPPQQNETKTDKLKVNQIALIHVYEGLQITRENAREIAAKHGYTAKNSGEGLFQDYTNYCSTANRKGKPTPCTPKKLKNKIELFESVVNYLSDNNKQRAIDEIKILNTIFENEYQ